MASGLVRLLTAASVAGLTSITGVASAQEAPPTLPGQGQADIDPARRLPPVRQNEAAATGAPRADCPLAGQGAITLSAVIAEGATYVSQAEVDAAVADLLNRELDLAVLCQARDRVAQLYAHRGQQLVRVDLPEQRISGGVLRLKVTEGYLARTTVEQPHAQGPSAALAAGYLARLEAQRPADWADVERAFYLIRDIPGAEVDLRLRRSDAGPGAVEAVAAFHPRRKFDVTLGAQRLGSEELGETTVFGRLDANSFTPFGERTSLVVQSSTSGEQLVVQLLEELRVGSSGLVALADVAYGRSRPAGALEPLEIEGESLVARLGLRYPVIAGRERAVNVGARFEAIDQQNDLGILRGIPGVSPVLFDEQLRVISADADTRWRPRRAPGFTASAGVELRKGVEGLGSSEAGDPALSRAEGDPAFGVLKAQARLRHQFAPGAGG
ncbi:MAG TPA: POTRA domain-containing protein, partial [Caulobacteraceae bacterium]|nr:POTRA domain-containing protein [Caulobacteraceae bacterium]